MLSLCKTTYRNIGGLFFLLLLYGCAGTPQTDAILVNIPPQYQVPVELQDVPFFPQRTYQCGPAALATVLVHQHIGVTPDELTPKIYIPQRQGSLQIEIIRTIRDYNLIPYVIEPELTSLLAEVKAGRPVLILQNLGVSWYPQWHYAVVMGYNLQEEEILLHSGEIKRYAMNIRTFEYTWRRAKHWGVLALQPDELPVSADSWQYLKMIVAFEQTRNWQVLNTAYNTGLQRWPDDRDLLMGYGTALYLQGRLDQARQHYERVLQLEDYAPAHNNLAQVLAEQGEFRRALTHANKAIDLGGVHAAQYQSTLDEIKKLQGTK